MSDTEFKSFSDIKKFNELHVSVTLKIHGTNAQILVYLDETGEPQVKAGSRTRWLTLDKDNFGFAAYVEANKTEIVEKLGHGRHYGEWYGPGINLSYGLTEKRFALFNTRRPRNNLPPRMEVVPVLYEGPYTQEIVEKVKADLLEKGHESFPGWAKHEGIVVFFPEVGVYRKSVFTPEETAWTGKKRTPEEKAALLAIQQEQLAQVVQYLQPIRLEKLLSRDEQLSLDYPNSLPTLAKMYVEDLIKETEVLQSADIKRIRKSVFPWIINMIEEGHLAGMSSGERGG